MAYAVNVMTIGDYSPQGMRDAFYNSPDGEPEDMVIDTLAFFETKEELDASLENVLVDFVKNYPVDSGCWVEVEVLDDEDDDDADC